MIEQLDFYGALFSAVAEINRAVTGLLPISEEGMETRRRLDKKMEAAYEALKDFALNTDEAHTAVSVIMGDGDEIDHTQD